MRLVSRSDGEIVTAKGGSLRVKVREVLFWLST